MKKLLLLSILMFFGCNDKEPEKVAAKITSELPDPYRFADYELSENSEKIMLLSILKKIQKDTLRLVLRDYIEKNPSNEYETVVDNIDTIAQKYNISKFKIASIIFSYRYEMLTKAEIEETAVENMANEQNNE